MSVARAADPGHVLSQLLSQALDHGLPPETLAGLARSSDNGPIWKAPPDDAVLGFRCHEAEDGDSDGP